MADYEWHVNVDIWDESDAPTEEGWYEIVDTELNQMTDYYFGEPRMTPKGISYWKTAGYPIIAWRKLRSEGEK